MVGNPCAVCVALSSPPEALSLGGKWSPLAVGGLSIVCDPLLITTIVAISRGFGRLSLAKRYEREHGYHPALPGIRANAMWGLVLGSLRLWVLAGVVLAVTLSVLLATETTPLTRYPDEATELRAALDDDGLDGLARRELAARHIARALQLGHGGRLCAELPIRERFASEVRAGREEIAAPLGAALVACTIGETTGDAFDNGAVADEGGHAVDEDVLAAEYPTLPARVRAAMLLASTEGSSTTLFGTLLRLEADAPVDAEAFDDILEALVSVNPELVSDELAHAIAGHPTFAAVAREWCARESIGCGEEAR